MNLYRTLAESKGYRNFLVRLAFDQEVEDILLA
jgi:hypothetical protein